MSSRHSSRTGRALVQMDLAFWYLHAHFAQLAALAAPTILAVCAIGAVIVAVLQTWDLHPFLLYVLFAILVPTVVLWVGTFLPLPSAVFAWRRASGSLPETGECFRYCLSRSRRLVPVAVKLFFAYLLWFTFFGVPLLYFGPRTCAAPAVALFEKERRIFYRSRRLLKEDIAINVLAALYFAIFLALALLLFLPRILLSAQGRLVASSLSKQVLDHLWIVELVGFALLISGIAVGWCISMTLLYREVRMVREGEPLREKLEQLRQELLGGQTNNAALPTGTSR
jgi:lysylphosphatidylglycerol synthetase-like protein (DUF2156 family)